MQDLTATLALLIWPLVALCLFVLRPLNKAILWTILGAQLLLPVGTAIKFTMVPSLDKNSIPNLCILLGCFLSSSKRGASGKFGIAEIFILMFVLGPVVTCELNGDPLFLPNAVLPGVGLYDAASALELAAITLIPFVIGRLFLRSAPDIEDILRTVIVAMLAYSIPMFFEVRFSPQLHNWVYGYFPSDFIQSVRGEGYRPMVFMGHGLIAAHFVLLATVAAAAFWRSGSRIQNLYPPAVTGYLAALLLFCRTLSAGVYGAVAVALILCSRPKLQIRLSVGLILVALLYPTLRSLDLFPTGFLVESARSISDDRAGSLKFRFDNEDQLLRHAFERPFFGWGRYGRNRVYDAETGRDNNVTDGEWIISIGQFGFIGFIAQFGLLSLGVFRSASALRYARSNKERIHFAALCLIVAVSILDLLPNSGLAPWTWLLSGSLLGRAEALLSKARLRAEPNVLGPSSQNVRATSHKVSL